MSFNQLSGTIPPSLGSLSLLTMLCLYNNQLSGVIPSSLGSLTALPQLWLTNNSLSGSLPASLGRLSRLVTLDLSLNLLSGTIPSSFSSLTSLRALSLANNNLSGTLPLFMGLPDLWIIELNNNAFSGSFPSTFDNLATLIYIRTTNNGWSGAAACPAGFAPGASDCEMCPVNTYAARNSAICSACPLGTTSLAGTTGVLGCYCTSGVIQYRYDGSLFAGSGNGFYQLLTPNATQPFICQPCPAGAICCGDGRPYALSGYWHLPDAAVFFPCGEGEECVSETTSTNGGCPTVWLWGMQEMPTSLPPPQLWTTTFAYPESSSRAASDWTNRLFNGGEPLDNQFGGPDWRWFSEILFGSSFLVTTIGFPRFSDPGVPSQDAYPDVLRTITASLPPSVNFFARTRNGTNGAPPASNCNEGHGGILCSECQEGWVVQETRCRQCPANSAFQEWPPAKQVGVCFLLIVLFNCAFVPYMLSPLFRFHKIRRAALSQLRSFSSFNTVMRGELSSSKLMERLVSLARFSAVPAKMVIENLQIIGSFERTMRVRWPGIFQQLALEFRGLNLNFLKLPTTACITRLATVYTVFHFITWGVTGLLAYMVLLWAVGRRLMAKRGAAPHALVSFDRLTLNRVIVVLTLAYEPIVEIVLASLSCVQVGTLGWRLRDEPATVCLSEEPGNSVRFMAILWIVVYVIGTPVFFLGLLIHYNIPAVARELQNNACIRALSLHAHLMRQKQPSTPPLYELTVTSISDEHVDILTRFVFARTEEDEPPRKGFIRSLRTGRRYKLNRLLAYTRATLVCDVVTWREAAEDDHRLVGAREAVGMLYGETLAPMWWWFAVEMANKLVITGLLGFIEVGSERQILFGLSYTFCALFLYVRYQPYTTVAYRMIGYAQSVSLFLYFLLALCLSSDIQILPSVSGTREFYAAISSTLITAAMAVPALIVLHRLNWPLEKEEEEESPSSAGSEGGGEEEELLSVREHQSDEPPPPPPPLPHCKEELSPGDVELASWKGALSETTRVDESPAHS